MFIQTVDLLPLKQLFASQVSRRPSTPENALADARPGIATKMTGLIALTAQRLEKFNQFLGIRGKGKLP